MHEMRDMIRSLVAEGRTVVLSSHLLDEVERTCDAVAIVDRGKVIRQGPIAELLAGHVGRRSRSTAPSPTGPRIAAGERPLVGAQRRRRTRTGWRITLPAGTPRDVIAEVARVLVSGGDLRVPAAAGARLARVVVPAGHQPTG